jgi:hypothetical protein
MNSVFNEISGTASVSPLYFEKIISQLAAGYMRCESLRENDSLWVQFRYRIAGWFNVDILQVYSGSAGIPSWPGHRLPGVFLVFSTVPLGKCWDIIWNWPRRLCFYLLSNSSFINYPVFRHYTGLGADSVVKLTTEIEGYLCNVTLSCQ